MLVLNFVARHLLSESHPIIGQVANIVIKGAHNIFDAKRLGNCEDDEDLTQDHPHILMLVDEHTPFIGETRLGFIKNNREKDDDLIVVDVVTDENGMVTPPKQFMGAIGDYNIISLDQDYSSVGFLDIPRKGLLEIPMHRRRKQKSSQGEETKKENKRVVHVHLVVRDPLYKDEVLDVCNHEFDMVILSEKRKVSHMYPNLTSDENGFVALNLPERFLREHDDWKWGYASPGENVIGSLHYIKLSKAITTSDGGGGTVYNLLIKTLFH